MAIDITNKNEKKINLTGEQIENALMYANEHLKNTRVWIDYISIKTVQELGNGIIKYTDSQGSYYRKIIDSPYEDIIYSDENLTIELTRRA